MNGVSGAAQNARPVGESLAKLFPASLVHKLAESLPASAVPESAVPSYTNRNPAIRWLMFRRLEMIRSMALRVLARNGAPAGRAALDFGCGIGMMIPVLAPRVHTLYLCDEQLVPARTTAQWFGAGNVICVLPEELESRIADASLQVITAADVLEHVDDLATVAETLRRKLRAGGALIVSGPTENWAYRCGRWIAGFTGEYHVRSVFEVEAEIRKVGFTRDQLRRLPYPVGPTLFRITQWRRAP